jgi:hypothetical protein
MKSSRDFISLVALLLFCGWSVSAQTAPSDAKEFNKEGLTFNYPNGWAFNDSSDKDSQKMTFGRPDSDAQIAVFVFRTPVTTPEKIAEAKRILVDKYVANTKGQFQQEDAKTTSEPATSEIGGVASEGVKIRAALGGVPGIADIEWAVVGEHLVVLTFLGPDRALTKASAAWDTIRNSIKLAEPAAPQPKPIPTKTP